ncbi:unnamed protein product [Haemonchus placei]|uniref:Secreted protein n=1 Tax=Haemonchus placei TaxID=6290 RepID=A0A0N4WL86_HAEPC|nr:unnamed protein product [Haemonchus placei]
MFFDFFTTPSILNSFFINIVFIKLNLKPISPQALSNSASIRSACSMFGVTSTMSSVKRR